MQRAAPSLERPTRQQSNLNDHSGSDYCAEACDTVSPRKAKPKWRSEVKCNAQSTDPLQHLAAERAGWWQPQPHPNRNEHHAQQRPSLPLALALSCKLCGDLLKDPVTSTECSHSFCYDCIMQHVQEGGHHNVCPVPECGVLLGLHPFDHDKLKYDFVLDGLVTKVFPRPLLDAALQARREKRAAER
mmetsp:Transcript_38077/g.84811  ORF Transcript_38077/g.84811 Transcript_38077/m.84811 type:complete len:187 (+) Transcript_38077:229-789(+)|eukprot:CAMPEP_0202901298 /NCGR_PEP_ID=MMETSP1392-20130828/14176_1 /ASSEMBLY_ACC=CAM_ASM_000868 /TAXON_ID=225041 /ORGANISM="Chlamydomonas chlamydogama, Strain SAG 11-48b" /LENGTH=186 /DNA_ID=CAMNT_0049587843 /DNA_START=222 /DNA_END=782 /DNA_ORIENTATION=-